MNVKTGRDPALGTAPVGKLFWKLALPAIAAQLVNVLYNIVDRIYIGHIPVYGAAALTRQALEPRLLGRQIGLSPLITLLALYTGFRLCGVAGMILFPIGAIFLRQVLAPPQPEG